MRVSHLSKAALYRRQAERLRATAQQTALVQTKLLLLKAAMYLEQRAEDEERKARDVPPNPGPHLHKQ